MTACNEGIGCSIGIDGLEESLTAILVAVQLECQGTALHFTIIIHGHHFVILGSTAVGGTPAVGGSKRTGATCYRVGIITAILDRANHSHIGSLASATAPSYDTASVGGTFYAHHLTGKDHVGHFKVRICNTYDTTASGITGLGGRYGYITEDIANEHGTTLCGTNDRSGIVMLGNNIAMQADILQCTRSLGEESSITARYVGNVNGEVITLSIEITVKPVAGIEDGIALAETGNLNVGHLLDTEETTIGHLVLDFTPVHVLSSSYKDSTISQVTLQMIVIEEAASGTYAIVPCVGSSGNTGSGIAVGYLGSLFTLCHLYEAMAVGSHRSIHLLALAKYGRHGIVILTNGLSPLDVGLVGVEHIAHLTALEILGGDIGNITIVTAPVIQSIVIVVGTILTGILVGTGAELHILGNIKGFQLASITAYGCAIGILLEGTLVDHQTVLRIGTCRTPAHKSATVCGVGTIDDHLADTVGGKEALIHNSSNTSVSGITCKTALDDNIDSTITDGCISSPGSNTGSMFLCCGNVTHHAQVLHDGGASKVAEECSAILLWEEIHFDGVSLAIECSGIPVGITANLSLLGTIVDVSRKLSIGMDLTTIYKFSKGLQVLSCPNLIGTVLFVKCPCSGAHDCQYSHQAQTKKSFTHK